MVTTGRIEFYREDPRRWSSDRCCGDNCAQVAWTEDLARAVLNWLPFASSYPMWDGLPDRGLPVRQLLALIVRGAEQLPRLVEVPSATLARHLPDYLEYEPLWREEALPSSEQNIFTMTATVATPYSEWICNLKGAPDPSFPILRNRELRFIEQLAL